MIPFFTPDKGVAPVSLRAIEQWQLTHEGFAVVSGTQLTTTTSRGRTVWNTDDGLFYFYSGTEWMVIPGQTLRNSGSFTPFINTRTSNSPQSADAGHDVYSVTMTAQIPTINPLFQRFRMVATTDGFVYAVDPAVNATFALQITDNSNNVLAEASSMFITGAAGLKSGGVTVVSYVDNSVLPVGTMTLKIRVAASVTTQAYGTTGSATKPTTFSIQVV